MNSTKASNAPNPKEAVGTSKLDTGLVPDTALIEMALAFLEGALKYGRYNWRIAGVRASTYNAAMDRHRKKWWNGRDHDPVTQVHELGSVMACCAIVLDAIACGKLNDDRPPKAPMGEMLDSPELLARIAHLKELFKDHNPRQWTIADVAPTEADQQAANNGKPVADPFEELRDRIAAADRHINVALGSLTVRAEHLDMPDPLYPYKRGDRG